MGESVKRLREEQLRVASESAVRRLARYCDVEEWDTLSLPLLIDELGWKGVIASPYPKGCY